MDGSPIDQLTQCLICSHEKDEKLIVTKKGIETILRFAGLRNDKRVSEYIENVKQTKFTAKVFIHALCRTDYTDTKRIKHHIPAEPPESPKRHFQYLTGKSTAFFVALK